MVCSSASVRPYLSYLHSLENQDSGLLATAHQVVLGRTSLQDWTLGAKRIGLIAQNKEGLVSFVGRSSLSSSPFSTQVYSLAGYLAIYLLGIASGLYILPPDPAFFRVLNFPPPAHATPQQVESKRNKVWQSKPGKLANLLGSYAVVWWTVFGVVRWVTGVEVSRRLVRSSTL